MKKRLSLSEPQGYIKLFIPLLFYPAVYFPYRLWGIETFAGLVRRIVYGEAGNPMWTAFNVYETIIYFWLAVSAVVTLISIVLSVLKIRPWYFIPLYLLAMISFCGILALAFYNLMT